MTTETLIPSAAVLDIDFIGRSVHRFEFIKKDNVLPDFDIRQFCVLAYNLEQKRVRHFDIPFHEFASRHPDHEKGFITCVQFDHTGEDHEKLLPVWDYINEVFTESTVDNYFNEVQKKAFRDQVEHILLDIIDGATIK